MLLKISAVSSWFCRIFTELFSKRWKRWLRRTTWPHQLTADAVTWSSDSGNWNRSGVSRSWCFRPATTTLFISEFGQTAVKSCCFGYEELLELCDEQTNTCWLFRDVLDVGVRLSVTTGLAVQSQMHQFIFIAERRMSFWTFVQY